MGLFHNKEQYQGYNIYSMKKYVDKKRIMFNLIVSILIIITIILIIYYVIDTSIRLRRINEFSEQILQYKQKQEEIAQKEEEEKQKRIPVLTDEGKENIKHIYHSETKRAFLTFDDGPSNNTNDILDILKQNQIKATFFVLGVQVERMPETTRRIFEEGHYIANHGYSHIYSSIYGSPEQVLNEFNQCNQIVANAIEIPEYNSHLFRFPGGFIGGKYQKVKDQAKQILEENNILYVDWNALTGDSEKVNPSREYLMQNLINTTNQKDSVVILMHDSQAKRITVDTLQECIQYLREQGYEFENFYSIIK